MYLSFDTKFDFNPVPHTKLGRMEIIYGGYWNGLLLTFQEQP